VSVSVKDSEDSSRGDRAGQRQAPEGDRKPQNDDRQRNPKLDEREAQFSRPDYAPSRHRAEEGERQPPQSPPAEMGCQETDGEHR
jgi:hypothetical protein